MIIEYSIQADYRIPMNEIRSRFALRIKKLPSKVAAEQRVVTMAARVVTSRGQ